MFEKIQKLKLFMKGLQRLDEVLNLLVEIEELKEKQIQIEEVIEKQNGTIIYLSDYINNQKKKKEVHIAKLDESVILPVYMHDTDSGMDVYANEDITIYPGETVIVKTGLCVALPEGTEIQVRPRSGVSFKTKLRIANSPGTIDAGYRDEIGIIIDNISRDTKEERTLSEGSDKDGIYHVKKGERIAQFVFADVLKPNISETTVDKVKSLGKDRKGGFGSTGVKKSA